MRAVEDGVTDAAPTAPDALLGCLFPDQREVDLAARGPV
jgi:hypothetical protein